MEEETPTDLALEAKNRGNAFYKKKKFDEVLAIVNQGVTTAEENFLADVTYDSGADPAYIQPNSSAAKIAKAILQSAKNIDVDGLDRRPLNVENISGQAVAQATLQVPRVFNAFWALV